MRFDLIIPPTECWVNIYIDGRGFINWANRDRAIKASEDMADFCDNKCLYRIHVRFK